MRANGPDRIELLTPAEMGRADALTIQGGVPGHSLMQRAGKNVAAAASDMLRASEGRRIVVFCGPGNNGGDGYVAARLLREQGFEVAVGALGDRKALRGDAAEAFAEWGESIVPAEKLDPRACDLIIDALFGAGLSRPLDGEALALVQRINASGTPVLAVDVPSGLDGATGAIGSSCVQARKTVTFFRLKPGHVLLPGRRACGLVHLTQIGIEDAVLRDISPKNFLNAPALWRDFFPWPAADAHKYQRGHLVVASGPTIRTGAARLAARARLEDWRGPGDGREPGRGSGGPRGPSHRDHAALRGRARRNGASFWPTNAFRPCVLGPAFGIGGATREVVETILASADKGADRPFGLVLDADALTSYSRARFLGWRNGSGGAARRLFSRHMKVSFHDFSMM